jgi:hypothetical protein
LFAAGYDHTSLHESSLIIWDIEKSMSKFLNDSRIDEELEINNLKGNN